MENNRQFELMRSAARQKLEGADPVQLSVLTGLCWDGRTFDTETLGIPIRISWPECQISPALEMWHDLTIFAVSGKYERNYAHGKIPCPE